MNKKILKKEMKALLESGVSKSEIFEQYREKDIGIKEKKLAYLISSLPDIELCLEHDKKNNILITLMFICMGLSALNALSLAENIEGTFFYLIMGISIGIPLLFIWGFYKYSLTTYNVFIILSISQLHKNFEGFSNEPIVSIISLSVSIGLIAYAWFIKSKLYPEATFLGVKKSKSGEFQFSS